MAIDVVDAITPAAVRIAPPAAQAPVASSALVPATRQYAPWLVIGGIAVVALAAMGLLPGHPGTALTSGELSAPLVTTGADISGRNATPEALRQREHRIMLRHLAGDALDELIRGRTTLKSMRVTAWDPVQYQFAEQEAGRGEAAFRDGDYNAATFHYRNAGQAFNALVLTGQQQRAGAISNVFRALAIGDVAIASAQLKRAQAIGPGGADLIPLQRRVTVLPKVLAATARGDAALDAGDIPTARNAYAAALALDAQYEPPRAALANLTSQAAQKNYLAAMSQGYSALQHQAFDAARSAFDKAQTLHPDRQAAAVALQDLAGKRTTSTLAQLENDSARLAAEERYAEAIKVYQQALAIDPSLAFAKRGLVVAKQRQQLLQALNNVLAHPERQSSDDTRTASITLRARVAAVAEKGQQLQNRMGELDALLARSAAPVAVTLQSDNITEVRLYRLGALGHFAQKQVALRPGRYVATGVRDGFRDTRVTFDVAPNMASVVIRCDESIQ